MPRVPPPAPAKGTRHPGAGRVAGTPNKVSVEARQLVSEMVNDPHYQRKLREDFRERRVHPTIESLVWAYHLGKPHQPVDVELRAQLAITASIENERRAFALLDVAEMEALAAASQALTDRALALSRARLAGETPLDVVDGVITPDMESESLGKVHGSDNGYSVTSDQTPGSPPESLGESSIAPQPVITQENEP